MAAASLYQRQLENRSLLQQNNLRILGRPLFKDRQKNRIGFYIPTSVVLVILISTLLKDLLVQSLTPFIKKHVIII